MIAKYGEFLREAEGPSGSSGLPRRADRAGGAPPASGTALNAQNSPPTEVSGEFCEPNTGWSTVAGAPMWRWGELNPRPMSCCQGFSGRSLRWIFSAPAMLQTAGRSGPSHLRVPFTPMTEVNSSGYLNDARIRGNSNLGLT